MLTSLMFAGAITFTGHLVLVEPAGMNKPGIVLAPIYGSHEPTLIVEATSYQSSTLTDGLKFLTTTTPLGVSGYALTLTSGWDVSFESAAPTDTKPYRTSLPKPNPTDAVDYEFLNYVTELKFIFNAHNLDGNGIPFPLFVKSTYTNPVLSDWTEIGARLWLTGASHVKGRLPLGSPTRQWKCALRQDMTPDPQCYFQSGTKDQGLTDVFEARFPDSYTTIVLKKYGGGTSKIVISSGGSFWLVGAYRGDTLPKPSDPIEHMRHYSRYVQTSITKPGTILRRLAYSDPVFCPPGVLSQP